MSAVRELTDALICAGMHPADAAMLIARAGVEMVASGPSKAAIRTRKWRAGKASQTVTGDDSVTLNETVTERHKPSLNVTRDDASLSKEEKIEIKKEKRESTKASQLPDGWRPDADSWTEAVSLLGSEERAEYELKKFKDHALEKGRVAKNWNAAWRNWAKRSVEFGGRNGHTSGAIRTNQATGSPQTRDTAIIAGMGRALERRRAARDAADPGRQDVREERYPGAGTGTDAESGPAAGDDSTPRQLALLPAGYAGS